MRARIGGIRSRIRYDDTTGSNEIGCIQLIGPTFFPPDQWVPQPNDWHVRTQRYVYYDLDAGEGSRVWEACQIRSQAKQLIASSPPAFHEDQPRYGTAHLVAPRLGQRTFRIAVLEAYSRSCCVTGEHSLPALEASHIRPYASAGPHDVSNGLLFRADIHRLYDKGHVTVTTDSVLEVGTRLREEFQNGKSYYPLHGTRLQLPGPDPLRPSSEFLQWHNERVFLGKAVQQCAARGRGHGGYGLRHRPGQPRWSPPRRSLRSASPVSFTVGPR